MAKPYRPYLPDQEFLLPPSLREWLPEGHLAYFVSDVVDELDLSAIEAVYGEERRGQPPYHPRMMTKLLVYGYCVGVFSSRRIQTRVAEDIAFRVLAAGNEPDFRTISDFRKIHLQALEGLFEQVLKIALKAGAIKVGRVVLDGTKVKANASKHKAMSYGRMEEKGKQLREEVKKLLAQAEATDSEEDARYGNQRSAEDLPTELQRRRTRLQRIREAKRALEQRAEEKAAEEGRPEEQAQPKDTDQYNFTDPESRIMKGADGFVQGYNAQAGVEPNFQLIVGQTVTQAANDKEQLQPMVQCVEQQAGQKVTEVVGDNGYCSEKNLAGLDSQNIDGYIGMEKQKHGAERPACPRGAVAEGGHSSGSNEAEVADEGRGGDLRDAQDDRGTSVWTDQTGAWLSAVPIAGAGEGAGGVGAGVPDAQHFEDAPDLLWIVLIQAGST